MPGGTAAADLPHDAWTHLRLVLQGSRGALFIGADTTTPAILIELARPPQAGEVALRSFVPNGTLPADVPFTAFSNVVVRPGVVPFDFASVPPSQGPRTSKERSRAGNSRRRCRRRAPTSPPCRPARSRSAPHGRRSRSNPAACS